MAKKTWVLTLMYSDKISMLGRSWAICRSRDNLISEMTKEKFSSFDDSQSLEHELNQIEETFRNPNLLIETIKEKTPLE